MDTKNNSKVETDYESDEEEEEEEEEEEGKSTSITSQEEENTEDALKEKTSEISLPSSSEESGISVLSFDIFNDHDEDSVDLSEKSKRGGSRRSDITDISLSQRSMKTIDSTPSKIDSMISSTSRTDLDSNESGVILTKEIIRDSLYTIGKAYAANQYAFIKIDLSNKELNDIDLLEDYIHLRSVNISQNKLTSLDGLEGMKYLEILNAEGNKIFDVDEIPDFEYLQSLNLSRNLLSSIDGLNLKTLSYLNISVNAIHNIKEFNDQNFPFLITLDLRKNNIRHLNGFKLSRLKYLFLTQNKLITLDGIENCKSLIFLTVRSNQILKIATNEMSLPSLQYLNLRDNNIKEITQIVKLGKNATNLETIILKGNPITIPERHRSKFPFRTEISSMIPSLKRLDKQFLTEIELEESEKLRNKRNIGEIEPIVDYVETENDIAKENKLQVIIEEEEEEEDEDDDDSSDSDSDDEISYLGSLSNSQLLTND